MVTDAIQRDPAALRALQPHTQFSEREEEVVTKTLPYLVSNLALWWAFISLVHFTIWQMRKLGFSERGSGLSKVTGHVMVLYS